jgi:hypothetical protein
MAFLITGFGRSGTYFLQQIMNKSEKWMVEHEPRGGQDEKKFNCVKVPQYLQDIFNQDYYGEVNSRLRFYIDRLNVAKKGIIIRQPRDIFKSTVNRGKNPRKMARDIYLAYTLFSTLGGDVVFIDFSKMTTDVIYLNRILKYFGVGKLVTSKDIRMRININKNNFYKSYEDLPQKYKDIFEKYDWGMLMKILNSKTDDF